METSFTSDVRQIKYATGYEFGYTRVLRQSSHIPFALAKAISEEPAHQRGY